MPAESSHEQHNEERSGIGTLNEFSLHADLIAHFAQPGDLLEADVDGYLADILRKDQIIEVQTRNLAALKKKVAAFAQNYQVTIIHPVTHTKWIVRKNPDGEITSRRKSPKRGRVEEIFTELVRAWSLIESPSVSLQVPLIEAEEVWLDDGQGSWRRKYWSISERHLLGIKSANTFHSSRDFLKLLPPSLPIRFTNKQLAEELGVRRSLAGKITYTFKKINLVELVDKLGNQHVFEIKKERNSDV